ncbi:polysaccharide deacetylase family protein [Paenarthrobacter sp. PH39-S1]|uniref:polysaccharide deacetylase family protein n=1 Tax=Paenarthrobacter sp. PH39-S1 TaxID=3046204 RepID=UPI0024B94684|nr:polysaccharide deacetylase family protein [Paenarthrobacter sp. PH39-S1]MDJ0354893.1 polysaccharide deacetylase family protein [Paenarthrobacter sp. PH39-S1]
MARHLGFLRHPARRIGIALTLLGLSVLVLTGVWGAGDAGPTSSDGRSATVTASATAPVPTTMAADAATAQSTPTASAAVPTAAPETSAASVTPSSSPAAAEPPLVPDYILPPVTDGMVPVLTKVPTEQKVVFLTIDDGATKTPAELQILKANGIKASLFLSRTFVSDNPGFFKDFVADGSLVEDHTVSHQLNFIHLSYEQQKAEICQMADFAAANYGRRPVFFRPPGGPYTNVTRKAAADCGMKAIIDWEAKANAGGMDYQYGSALRPGEIVLMHFRPEFAADMQAFLTAQKAAGLKVVLLEDYLQTG